MRRRPRRRGTKTPIRRTRKRGQINTGTNKLNAQPVYRVRAIDTALRAFRTSAKYLGIVALGLMIAAPGAGAGQKQPTKPDPGAIKDTNNGEPMVLVVSVGAQKVDVYRGTQLITTSAVSTGTAAHPTMIGAFSILEKQRWHHSNMYSAAPMPWMNRITWSGTALHAGVVPGYPASHGCIRLPYSFAPKLFQITTPGDNVIVSRVRPVPTLIEHQALFQPLPLPSIAMTVDVPKITAVQPISSPLSEIAAAASPVILAKAEAPTTVDSEPQVHFRTEQPKAEAPFPHVPDIATADPDRVHAIAPEIEDAAKADGDNADKTKESAQEPNEKTAGAATEIKVAAVIIPSPVPVPDAASTPAPAGPPPAAAKLDKGAAAAAKFAADPPSNAPLRILITRRTQRDRIIGIQEIFADMGKLERQNFDGSMGKATIAAVKDFQKANDLPPTGAITDELIKKVYEVAGKGEPPAGHLYVRQKFDDVFDAPVSFSNPDEPLGTHVYTALKFAPADTSTRWMTLDVQGDGTSNPLDRIQVPDELRKRISERLTPGSTLIIADTSINSANLPRGGDFVVLAKGTGAKVSATDEQPRPRSRNRVAKRSFFGDDFSYSPRSSSRGFLWGRGNGPWSARPW